MSWLLPMWISLGFLLLCQATLYQTIQQHYVARPGRTDILTLGSNSSAPLLSHELLVHTLSACILLMWLKIDGGLILGSHFWYRKK